MSGFTRAMAQAQHSRAVKRTQEYIESRARANQVNNYATGKVTAIATDGRHTVELTSGRTMMIYSASGSNYTPGDYVSVRFLSDDRRQAEIAGKTTKVGPTTITKVYR